MKTKESWTVVFAGLLMGLTSAGCSRGPAQELKAGSGVEQVMLDQQVAQEVASSKMNAAMDMEVMADKRAMRELTKNGSMFVTSETPGLPRVRFPDGQVGASDSCAVRMGNKLNRQVPPAYVNGQPVGFC